MPLPVVAIVGRPNVGKSTLFNRLVGFQKATVDDRPGVTRDRLYEEAEILDRRVLTIDTGGLDPEPDTDLLDAMRRQSLVAMEEADVIIFVCDARTGLTPADREVADLLRRTKKPVVLAVNKIDGPKQEDLSADFWEMGLPLMVTISAEHGRGIYDLREAVVESLPPATDAEEYEVSEEIALDAAEGDVPFGGPIRIAVIGKPNIGKSTLINRLLGENRHLVHDMPGTTMDPVDSSLTVDNDEYVLVDTAGVRRKSRIEDHLERYVSLRSIRSIERCHVALLMIDGTEGPSDQDARLAQLVIDRGRALILLVNKWDLAKNSEEINSKETEEMLEMKLPHAIWAPHLFISAKTGKGVQRILPMVKTVFASFNKRVSTSAANRWLKVTLDRHTPPQRYHRPVRIYYCAQTRVRPPSFIFFSNTPDGIAQPYRRYLNNRLREDFGFEGTPVRTTFKRRRKLGESEDDDA